MQDITGFGLTLTILASLTFPVGFQVTQFADDSDPLDFSAIQMADTAMGLNGDLITWARAQPLPAVISVIPGSQDDINLGILADANRVGQGKRAIVEEITMNVVYPDGSQITLTKGRMISATFGKPVSSGGRLKSKSYAFTFENKIGQ